MTSDDGASDESVLIWNAVVASTRALVQQPNRAEDNDGGNAPGVHPVEHRHSRECAGRSTTFGLVEHN
jgi:hypothetical protein